MPSAFTLYGELVADTSAFERSLKGAEGRLKTTESALEKTERASQELGDTSAVVARRYEKLNERIGDNRERLQEAAAAYQKGAISAKQYANILASVEKQTTSLNSRIKDANARTGEIRATGASHFQNQIRGATGGFSDLAAIFTGNRLSGATTQITAVGEALSAIPGPAGLAAAGIAVLGTAVVGIGAGLFKLSKDAAEFGSEIFDASTKTGLSAETLSSLKFAADQSGSSLEKVTGGLAKFSKTVGEAAMGSEKSAEKLKLLGITPQEGINDLDAALTKVFQRIADAKPGIEQITIAQQAFGKSGADLIPFIDSFGGNLEDLVAKAKDLGVTITDDAAASADEFGDQLDVLDAQMKGVARTIGMEMIPVFLELATELSSWLAANKEEVKSWGQAFADAADYIRESIEREMVDLEELAAFIEQIRKNISEGKLFDWEEWYDGVSFRKEFRALQKELKGLDREMRGLDRAMASLERVRKRKTGSAFLTDIGDEEVADKASKEAEKALEKANKKAEADQKKMIADAIKKAKEWAEHVKKAGEAVTGIFASTSDNPFTKIFLDGEAAVQKMLEATKGLGSELQNTLRNLLNNQTATKAFVQQMDNALKSLNLRRDAGRFIPNNLSKLSDSDFLQKQLNAIGAGGPITQYFNPEKLAEIDRKIIALTQNADPSKLTYSQNKLASDARLREADRVDDERAEDKKIRRELNRVLDLLTKAVDSGSVVRIINEAPDKAKVNSRPRQADSNAFFGK